MRKPILIYCKYATSLLVLTLIAFPQNPSPAQPPGPSPMAQAVVEAIDKNYLNAHANPLWNIAKQKIITGNYHDSAAAFKDIQTQLATLEDSELNMLSPEEIKATQSEALGEKIGLGLPDFALDLNISSGEVRVVTPIVGSTAMNARIEPHDIIVSVNGKTTNDMTHDQVMDALRASPSVHLEIRRGQEAPTPVALEASSEKLRPVESALKPAGKKKIGYIRLAQFTPDAGAAVKQTLASLEQAGASGFVLDLRNNPGGFLNAAREVAGFFATGTLGYKRDSKGKRDPLEAAGKPLTEKPLVILINAGTASAAEFLASGLQALHRATLVGVHSYGRGRAQIFFPLSDGYGIQIPSVELLTPTEKGYKGAGITPDLEVPQGWLPEKELGTLRDKQFTRAVMTLTNSSHP